MVPALRDELGVPAIAEAVFGARVALAERYAGLLRTVAVARGLLGPREADRVWERHLCNCAVVADLLPQGARVVDVGSGAGLPGVALAIRRPDLQVDLVDSLERRTEFLAEVVAELELVDTVQVARGRVEDLAVRRQVGAADWVTARAVAPLDRLAGWCLPLLSPGGRLLAMKGARAADELEAHQDAIRRLGGTDVRVIHCGTPPLDHPVTVVQVRRGSQSRPGGARDSRRSRRGGR